MTESTQPASLVAHFLEYIKSLDLMILFIAAFAWLLLVFLPVQNNLQIDSLFYSASYLELVCLMVIGSMSGTLCFLAFGLSLDRRYSWMALVMLQGTALLVFIANATYPHLLLIWAGLVFLSAVFAKGFRRFRLRRRYLGLILLGCSVSVYSFVVALLLINPIEFSRAMGTLLLLYIFVFLTSIFLTGIWLIGKVLFVLASALFLSGVLFNEIRNEAKLHELNEDDIPFVHISVAFGDWLLSRTDLDFYRQNQRPYPVFIVATEGGGIYAAAHAYSFLHKSQLRCGMFSEHIFSLIGVSGGAVGNAMFYNETMAKTNEMQAEGCSRSEYSATQNMLQDHLSPVVGAFLFLDVTRRISWTNLWTFNRSTALKYSLAEDHLVDGSESFLEKYMSAYFGEVMRAWQSQDDPISQDDPVHADAKASGPPRFGPALMPVATNIATGNRLVFAPFNFESTADDSLFKITLQGASESYDFDLGDATVASASFPWITPTMRFGNVVLADGGYFENISASTAFDIALMLETLGGYGDCGEYRYVENPMDHADWGCSIPFSITYVFIRSVDYSDAIYKQSFFSDPVATMLKTRESRGDLSVRRVYGHICDLPGACIPHPDHRLVESLIDPRQLGLPLGWKLTYGLAQTIDEVVVPRPVECDSEIAAADILDRVDFDKCDLMNFNGDSFSLLEELLSPFGSRSQ